MPASKPPPSEPFSRTRAARGSPGWHGLAVVVRWIALVVGASITFLSLGAVAALVHPEPAVRLSLAGTVGLLVPIIVARRLRPDALERETAGLTTEVLAVTWMVVAVAMVGGAHRFTQPLLLAEARRWADLGAAPVAQVVGWLAGVSWHQPVSSTPPNAGSGGAASTPVGQPPAQGSGEGSGSDAGDGSPAEGTPATADAGGAAEPGPADAGAGGAVPDGPAPPPPNEPAEKEAEPLTLEQLTQQLSGSVVGLAIATALELRSTTAVVLDERGTVVSLRQPVVGARGVAARLPDGSWVEGAEVVAVDETLDVVLLRLNLPTGTVPAPLADPAAPLPATPRCLGRPLGLSFTVGEPHVVNPPERPTDGAAPWLLPLAEAAAGCRPGDLLVGASGSVVALIRSVEPGPSHLGGPMGAAAAPPSLVTVPAETLQRLLRRPATEASAQLPGMGDQPLW